MAAIASSSVVGRAAALGFACVGIGVVLPDPAAAQELEASSFEQSGKLKFKFQNKFGSVMPGGGVSLPESSRIKFPAEAFLVFGPGDGLEANEFLIPIMFSDGQLVLGGTYSTNSKGKVNLVPDAQSFTEQLDAIVLGSVEDCRVKAKVKIKENALRTAKSRIKSRCKLRGVKPPQRLKVRFKASGSETPP